VDRILLGPRLDLRYTQDSPVLPEVWSSFAADPAAQVDVLITPYKGRSAGVVAVELEAALRKLEHTGRRAPHLTVAYLEGVVAARVSFQGLVRVVLTRSQWWKDGIKDLPAGDDDATRLFFRQMLGAVLADAETLSPTGRLDVSGDMARVLTLIALTEVSSARQKASRQARRTQSKGTHARALAQRLASVEESLNYASSRKAVLQEAAQALTDLLQHWRSDAGTGTGLPTNIWSVTLNRPAYPAIKQSVPAIKADAAQQLFNVDCSRLCWAILDSGIDARHPAFLRPDGKSRVERVYDFAMLRPILNVGQSGPAARKELAQRIEAQSGVRAKDVLSRLEAIERDRESGRTVDWSHLEPLLVRSDDTPPYSDHGTHVAGILAANWKGRSPKRGEPLKDMLGVCPTIRLYDMRVLCETLEETEFAVIGALQLVRHINDRNGYLTIHGANLSLSIPHDVRNFACGRTPVCEEANRLAANNVVVVVAAGNHGYQQFQTHEGLFESYSTVSITDPGNADDVITVGSTHRYRPFTYGVSFFSSRGPTGDGRIKPDLVAPGEKIEAPAPNGSYAVRDGTSMAAPHVSGAAAMLMARHSELMGQPARIKKILCSSATDLGRERYFQGQGMLDVLRAMQAV
jgi:hypothetical protein